MIKFYRDVLDGPLYWIVVLVSIVLIMSIIGYVMDKKRIAKEYEDDFMNIDDDIQNDLSYNDIISNIDNSMENIMPEDNAATNEVIPEVLDFNTMGQIYENSNRDPLDFSFQGDTNNNGFIDNQLDVEPIVENKNYEVPSVENTYLINNDELGVEPIVESNDYEIPREENEFILSNNIDMENNDFDRQDVNTGSLSDDEVSIPTDINIDSL